MSLLEKIGMIKIYLKNGKKSIRNIDRLGLFFLLALLILILSPFVLNLLFKLSSDIRQVNLYLSPHFEELFGAEITEELLQKFGEQNPELRVRLLKNQDERGRGPDILIFDDSDYNAFVAVGALAELNPYINPETGIQTAIPLVSFMDLLFYNIELLQSAGFDRPPKTREEFLASARAVATRYNDRVMTTAGSAVSLSPEDGQALSRDIFSWIWAGGGDFWTGENTPFMNTRAITADISFFGSLYRENTMVQRIFDTTGEQRLEEFARGRVALMVASTRVIPFLRERMGDEAFGITTIPFSGAGLPERYGISLSGIYAGISADCANPDEAWVFLEFLAGQSSLFCEIFKAVPGVVSDIIPGEYIMDDPFYSKAQAIFESSVMIEGFSGKPGAYEYENAVREELQTFFESTRSVQETVIAIQRRWDEVE
jgi:ABC-type glycerol-3-phosphate transport system substrate-binding protein